VNHLTGYISAAVVSMAVGLGMPLMASAKTNQDAAKQVKQYVQTNGLACMGCHGVSEKKIGPSWVAVSKKFHANPKEISILTDRIHNGGSGTWGSVPMPPNMATKEQSAKLAHLIAKLYKP